MKKENTDLVTELETTKTQQIADQKERDTLRDELKAKLEEIDQLKTEYERAQKQVQEMQETNSEAKKVKQLNNYFSSLCGDKSKRGSSRTCVGSQESKMPIPVHPFF